MTNRKECPIRNENNICLCVGEFCTTVNDTVCQSVRQAYTWGVIQGKAQAQKPRVMTLEEVKVSNDPVFFENKSGILCDWAINCVMNGKHIFLTIRNASVQTYRIDRYGISWRCWTFRPTDEQKATTPWES